MFLVINQRGISLVNHLLLSQVKKIKDVESSAEEDDEEEDAPEDDDKEDEKAEDKAEEKEEEKAEEKAEDKEVKPAPKTKKAKN